MATVRLHFPQRPDFCGDVDAFDYQISDLAGLNATATVELHVLCVDDAPVALDDYDTTDESVPLVVDIAANDTDADGDLDATSVILSSSPPTSQGTVVNNGDGTITFTPTAFFCGDVVNFNYIIYDVNGLSATATIHLYVRCSEDPPIALDDYGTTDEDTPVTVNVSSNDSDPDGNLDPTSVVLLTSPPASQGTVVNNGDGTITFTPAADFFGIVDPFDYEIFDTNGGSDIATVYINVNAGDDAPIAIDDYDTTNEDTPVVVNVAGNDLDIDGDLDPTSVVLISIPSTTQGTVLNNGNGRVTYIPAVNFHGDVDPFDYVIYDAAGYSDTATVYIHVLTINDAPVAVNDTASTLEEVPVAVNVSANDLDVDGDLDPNSVVLLSSPPTSQGTVTNNGDGSILFSPAVDFTGAVDPFDYEIFDTNGAGAIATVFITVGGQPDPPVAVDDNATTDEDTPVIIVVVSNDSDPDGDLDPTSVVTLTTPPASQGIVTNNGDGSIRFNPASNFNGVVDPFDYVVFDGTGLSDTATVFITVSSVIDLPTAVNDYDTTDESTDVIVDIAANDFDPDGDLDPTSIVLLGTPPASQGTVTNNGDGTITFSPTTSFSGDVDPFDYVIYDATGNSDTATVYVHVIDVVSPPTANDDMDDVCQESVAFTNVLDNDTDLDGTLDPSSVTVVTQPLHGTATVNPDGTIRYTHNGSVTSADSYTYSVADNDGAVSVVATVYMTIADAISVSGMATDYSCGVGGTVDATVTGGVPPYTYQWSTGQTTEDVEGLEPGVVFLDVTDANGCVGGTVFMIMPNGMSIEEISVRDNNACRSQNGGLVIDLDDVFGAGVPPYYVNVNDQVVIGPFHYEPMVINGIPSGTTITSLEITDVTGCTITRDEVYYIDGPAVPQFKSVTTVDADCDTENGRILIELEDVPNSYPPYSITFQGGAKLGPFDTESIEITDLEGGIYSKMTVENSGKCKEEYSVPILVIEPDCGCGIPGGLNAIISAGGTATLDWDYISGTTAYSMQVRKQGDTDWYLFPLLFSTSHDFEDLEDGVVYEWRVRSICGFSLSEWTEVKTFVGVGRYADPLARASVYPNPAVDQFTFTYETDKMSEVSVQVFSQFGQLVMDRTENVFPGMNSFEINSADFAAGFYEVVVKQEGYIETTKLLINR